MSYPQTGRAIRFRRTGGPEVLELLDVPVVAPGAGEVLVRVRAAGVNPVDAKIRSGSRFSGSLDEPVGVGADAAGEVAAVGEGVTGLSVGDGVVGFGLSGAYAEYVTAPARQWVPKPAPLGFEEGAAIGIPVATAYQVLRSLGLQPGHTLLVHAGSGAVGQAAIQFGRRWGARVVATASERNHHRLRELGATPVAYGDGLLERVRAAAPQGVDRVLEGAGTQEALEVSLAVVSDPAHIGEIVVPTWGDHGVTVYSGGLPGSIGPAEQALRAEAIPLAAQLAADGEFELEIARRMPLSDAAEAHRIIEQGHTRGKIVLIP